MVFDGGGSPVELFELDLCRRLGWTLNELDEQDAARVLLGLRLQDTRDRLMGIVRFLDSGGKQKPSDDDLKAYEDVKRLMAETSHGTKAGFGKEEDDGGPDKAGDADRTV